MGNSLPTENVEKLVDQSVEKFKTIPKEVGEKDTFQYRIQATNVRGGSLSMWHDIPLFPLKDARKYHVVNMINEIPRCSRKKFEISTNEPNNPIKQDVKKGQLREFSKGDVYFNYGCLPRTWEDPDFEHPDAKAKGDNDPLDVCEIGLRILGVAEVVPVKVLGVLCLIDEGEADWKIIAINVKDPWAALLNDVSDVEEKLPGTINSIREWFRTYKIPDGKPPNQFGLEERCMGADYAMHIVDECYESWKSLVTGKKDEIPTPVKRNLSYPKLHLTQLQDEASASLPPAPPVSTAIEGNVEEENISEATAKPRGLGACRNLSYPKLSLADLE